MPVSHLRTESSRRHETWITQSQYLALYRFSVENPEAFWAEQAREQLDWYRPWSSVFEGDFHSGKVRWFDGAVLNASVNCIDRHLEKNADRIAIYWESDQGDQNRTVTYREMYEEVCKLANGLRSCGINSGDRVCIYMPMVPEAVFSMLACARIGAVHSVVFGGFASSALRDRILDCDCRLVITADEAVRGGRRIPLKNRVDEALEECPNVSRVVVYKRTGTHTNWNASRDIDYKTLTKPQAAVCVPAAMTAEDALFILYTSGSTGKPKGVIHTTAGYLLFTAVTFRYVFDYHPGEVYWCAADIGWITGHSYMVYGPFCNGATTVMFEGVPHWPDAGRIWRTVDRYRVNTLYTAPTVIRTLMAKGNEHVERSKRTSLRLLGSVGEPINPEAWLWYSQVAGAGQCPVVDTWWQTETGGIMITPLPGATELRPGYATLPFFGIKPALLDENGYEISGAGHGFLVITRSWPGQLRTVYNNHQRVVDTYFSRFPGYYCTGDGARRDEDGYYRITGRIDDVINVSGHRIGSAEIESALALHPSIAEAAVVGLPDKIRGESVVAFAVPVDGVEADTEMVWLLKDLVKHEIGSFACPIAIYFCRNIPKTRSGKIMRRILRKIITGEKTNFGDTATLADSSVIAELVKAFNRQTEMAE